jgi:hypothetical protein
MTACATTVDVTAKPKYNAAMRILVTGSRRWTDEDRIRELLAAIDRQEVPKVLDALDVSKTPAHTLVHGGARGADTIAGEIAKDLGWTVEVHPADWAKFKKSAGAIRNQEMVSLGADLCLAFIMVRGESVGTKHCAKLARMAGIPVVRFFD